MSFSRSSAADRSSTTSGAASLPTAACAAIVALSVVLGAGCRGTSDEAQRATVTPQRVVLTVQADVCRSTAVNWRTGTEVSDPRAQLTRAIAEPDLAAVATEVSATTAELDLAVSDWNAHLKRRDAVVAQHTAVFENLEPGTTYAYRVGSKQQRAWSEWHHFRTPNCGQTEEEATEVPAAEIATTNAEAFRFLYFGDLQNGILSHGARVVRDAFAGAPDAAFALYAGDLVNDGHSDVDWQRWFDAGGWIYGRVPVAPVVGNHETRSLDRARTGDPQLSILWQAQFGLPIEADLPEALHETTYRFDVGPARFFVLDLTRRAEEQFPWLVRQLEQAVADGVRWKIVSFHFPVFSNAPDRDNPELRDAARPLFTRAGVDLVLQGHDHSYSRGHDPADGSAREADSPPSGIERDGATGPMYVVSVAGAKQYELEAPQLWQRLGDEAPILDRSAGNTQLWQVVEISPTQLDFRAYTAAGELYDRFLLIADDESEDGAKRLVTMDDLPSQRSWENTGPYGNRHWRE